MITLLGCEKEVHIDLSNGVWLFSNESSSGKSLLCKYLKQLRKKGFPVAAYDYNDYSSGVPIESVLIPDKFDVIELDRYSLFNGIAADLIQECSKGSVILIDCKQPLKFSCQCDFCFSEICENQIIIDS